MKAGLRIRPVIIFSFWVLAITLANPYLSIRGQSNYEHMSDKTALILSKVDKSVVEEFKKAWLLSGGGVERLEALVLIYRMSDGSISARLKGLSGKPREFSFTWTSSIIAVAHTHPNGDDPEPSSEDIRFADRYKVPIFTITLRGMYVYDPFTKKTIQVQERLNWLDLSRWESTHLEVTR